MNPDLELVEIRESDSFRVWSHGYPFRTVRWHFHPEYEIQLIVATSGKYFVGDFIGEFGPGNLVMSGPNLPHNWVSDVPEGVEVEMRGLIIQFAASFIDRALALFPELSGLQGLLQESRRGIVFSPSTGEEIEPLFRALLEAHGPRRLSLFISMLGLLMGDGERRPLASEGYLPDPSAFMSAAMNKVLTYIRRNLASELREPQLAAMTGQSASTFSRAFRRHTGMSFVQYVNRLRINQACQLLMSEDMPITDICYEVGFNNLSNFNRQFLAQKDMPPSRFRAFHQEQMRQTPQTAMT
ncbi:helix-turn-helix domain-containing protein [Consotaella salsifontis]|uniref:Transcriptional regulator, AraC family n=1 Tax=Consotaella salsifontis TaxID=1365950 RepID=A0A1T4SE50_9HYPH|nr:AraC family transcriptional regulator [Consotaella salsifontis]SKA26141.1 transcriptional regulator, AraC family [Consotaella salsifontis]